MQGGREDMRTTRHLTYRLQNTTEYRPILTYNPNYFLNLCCELVVACGKVNQVLELHFKNFNIIFHWDTWKTFYLFIYIGRLTPFKGACGSYTSIYG